MDDYKPDYKPIPEDMKKHNGIFFEEAKSGDPTHKIPGVENLIENLIAAMKISGCHEYDDVLKKCAIWATRAHKDYYEDKDVFKAMRHCNAILQEITHLCYDKRWVSANPKSFMYSEAAK